MKSLNWVRTYTLVQYFHSGPFKCTYQLKLNPFRLTSVKARSLKQMKCLRIKTCIQSKSLMKKYNKSKKSNKMLPTCHSTKQYNISISLYIQYEHISCWLSRLVLLNLHFFPIVLLSASMEQMNVWKIKCTFPDECSALKAQQILIYILLCICLISLTNDICVCVC